MTNPDKVTSIPLELVMDHINRLNKLNGVLKEAAMLTAFAKKSSPSTTTVSLVSFISEHYEKLSADFAAEIKKCVEGGAA